MPRNNYRATFSYFAVPIKNASTGNEVMGFMFPQDGKTFDEGNAADIANLEQFYMYYDVNAVFASIDQLIALGTTKSNKLYETLFKQLRADYQNIAITCLTLASSMCWVPHEKKGAFYSKFTPERALSEIEPAIKALLYAIEVKTDLLFPSSIVKNIAKINIEAENLEIKETLAEFKRHSKK